MFAPRSPLVSVILPAFNAEATLPATLESVLAQTHDELEILVVNDGSTDATATIARRYAAGDARVRVLDQANAGVARARNAALECARGAYAAWIDADDLWHPTKIARQLEVFRAQPTLTLVYTGYRLIDVDDRILPNHRPLSDLSGHTLCRQIATNFFSNVSSIMVPVANARRLGGHEPRLREWGVEGAEDLLFQLRLSSIGPIGCCRAALVGYRMHDGNMSQKYRRAARSNLKALDLVQSEVPQIPEWVFRVGRARVIGFAAFLLREGDLDDAGTVLRSVLRGQPAQTLAMCGRMTAHVLREKVLGRDFSDPAQGQRFQDADPESAIWTRPILLSARQQRLLEEVDRRLANGAARNGRG